MNKYSICSIYRFTQTFVILQDTREKCSDLENRNVSLAADKERLKVQVKEKESQFRVVQNERDCLERDVAHYISEIKVHLVGSSLDFSLSYRRVNVYIYVKVNIE